MLSTTFKPQVRLGRNLERSRDLIGAGEISAEEMISDSNPSSREFDADLSDEEKRRALSLIHSAKDIFQGHAVEKKPVSTIPATVEGRIKRFEFALDSVPYPVLEDAAPFSRFFLGKICKSMIERNPDCYFEWSETLMGAHLRSCGIISTRPKRRKSREPSAGA